MNIPNKHKAITLVIIPLVLLGVLIYSSDLLQEILKAMLLLLGVGIMLVSGTVTIVLAGDWLFNRAKEYVEYIIELWKEDD